MNQAARGVLGRTTGLTQTLTDLPIDRVVQIVEGEQSYEVLALKTPKLGQPPRRD